VLERYDSEVAKEEAWGLLTRSRGHEEEKRSANVGGSLGRSIPQTVYGHMVESVVLSSISWLIDRYMVQYAGPRKSGSRLYPSTSEPHRAAPCLANIHVVGRLLAFFGHEDGVEGIEQGQRTHGNTVSDQQTTHW